MSHTIRYCNKPIRKAHRIDFRKYERPLEFDENGQIIRETHIHEYGIYYHPYRFIRQRCSSRCFWCHPREMTTGSLRTSRRLLTRLMEKEGERNGFRKIKGSFRQIL